MIDRIKIKCPCRRPHKKHEYIEDACEKQVAFFIKGTPSVIEFFCTDCKKSVRAEYDGDLISYYILKNNRIQTTNSVMAVAYDVEAT